ncbi:WXG100 family type VII secretion target [Agromyces sp. MMS24-JH15]|uniref:WXG100 family type VII secretion target n=1 Tax=Agromyces sp. MMS24-JH15 TaxID=3243765 RepID=UPI003748D30C
MSDQQADTNELRQLAQTMTELVNYCSALKEGSSAFAYMLPAEWQGPAMQAFLGSFAAWAAGAAAMQDVAESLHDQVQVAHDAYSQTIDALDTSWAKIEANLG